MIDALSMSPILHFNPRAPRGARLRIIGNLMDIYRFQSTCPARGTTIRRNAKIISKDFNPRAPRGARHSRCRSYGVWRYFNPRAPRGARPSKNDGIHIQSNYFNPRAPRGARRPLCILHKNHGDFNPRAPRGARRRDQNAPYTVQNISIHVPREGHDAGDIEVNCPAAISIHVPREGHDR